MPEARLDKANQAFSVAITNLPGQEYQNVIDFSQDASFKAKVPVQDIIAYLEGDSTKALEFFRQVVDSAADNDAVFEAHVSVGPIYSDLVEQESATNAYRASLHSNRNRSRDLSSDGG